ncbi:MAG: TusE/DsrC/DsvC family sulfur relay protein [Syntrophaceae bacterium]
MEASAIQKEKIEFSSDGYLITPELWDENVAILIAEEIGIRELTEMHWLMIHYVREYWERN